MEDKRSVKPERVWLLDELRGTSILLMVLYHAGYDLVYIFGVNIPFFHSALLDFLQSFFAGLFILISGSCCRFSRSNLRRGAIALGLGLAMSLITFFFMPSQLIVFGILHLLGASMILYALLHPFLTKIPWLSGMLASFLLFAITWLLPRGWLGFFGLPLIKLPRFLYTRLWLSPLGFVGPGFRSSDFFPLLPWCLLFLGGSFLGEYFRLGKGPKAFYQLHSKPLMWIGRHTIWVYLLHQPVVYGVLWLFFSVTGL